ncbi:MAG: GLUG motif-containing protein [Desulforegulaceae bacterium]|nr:GLUG motif-containing protein [Desulforegulaceae bacterium]
MFGLLLRKMRIFVMAFAVFVFITGMPCFICSAEPVPAEPSGNGTAIDPYEISTLAELYWITIDSSRWNKHYIQTADINASDTTNWDNGKGWTPIGNNVNSFSGFYDGGGHTIIGLHINRADSCQGLFGKAGSGAEIKNLGLINLFIYGTHYLGGLIGYNFSLVSNCYSAGFVHGQTYVGGLIGNNQRTATNCYSTGNVTRKNSNPHTSFGGFCGNCDGEIKNSYATGSVFVEDGDALTDNGFAGTVGIATFNNNFWDSESSNQTGANGAESKTTLEMKQFKTFDDAGWNIKEITNSSYYNGSPYPGLVTSGINIWQINASYKITYNANDAQTGTVPDQQIKFYGQDLVLASNTGSLAKAGFFLQDGIHNLTQAVQIMIQAGSADQIKTLVFMQNGQRKTL